MKNSLATQDPAAVLIALSMFNPVFGALPPYFGGTCPAITPLRSGVDCFVGQIW
jgi:hypothetical protein